MNQPKHLSIPGSPMMEAAAEANVILPTRLDLRAFREPNWDGYGAEPVNPLALRRAEGVIASLPDGLPRPECSIEPDGCVSLDWMPAPHRTLSVSVGAGDCLPYAWVDGTDRGQAVARLVDGKLAARIVEEIRRFRNPAPSDNPFQA